MILKIPSKKIQINEFDHQIVKEFTQQAKEHIEEVKSICIQGNSYSVQFCDHFSEKILGKASNLESLDINDIFVARSKEEIPKSIQMIATGLVGKNLLRLDISHNAVNPFGAKALLKFLLQAKSLEVLFISNCGLGPLGVAEIAKGLEGTPNLRALSIARNRMQSEGIKHIAQSIKNIPKLQQLFVYQNTLRKEGLTPLFIELRNHCKGLNSFDLCDNFIREEATLEMGKLIIECLELKNLNLSDCLNEDENETIIKAFEESKNRSFERLGFNFIELTPELALRLLKVAEECPLKRLDIMGNQFNKKTKKAFQEVFSGKGVLSRFDDDQDEEEQEVTRLFEEMKLQ